MGHDDVLRLLEQRVLQSGGLCRAAKRLRVSQAYLSYVLAGKRQPGPKILRGLKLRRHVERTVRVTYTHA